MLKKLIGTKQFYKNVIVLTIPILIQNGITNFVNMLDNLMVGQVGQAEMIGVSVANQLIFVYNLSIFGAVSGAGIFGAQFFGNNDHKGLRDSFRFKIIFCTLLTVGVMALFFFCGPALIELYLKGEGSAEAAQISLDSGYSYLKIMLIGLIPSTLAQCWSSTLRETGQTLPPMVAGVTAVFANLILNYILIFGHFGAPEMGVDGAAVATVISRFVELLIVAVWTFADRERNIFIVGAFRSLRVPMALVKSITVKGIPLMVNEALWSAGVAFVNRCYSTEGLEVVAANNIAQTFLSVFSVAFLSVGVAIGIILGQLLGAGKEKEAKEDSLKLITFSVFVSVIVAILFALSSFFIPDFYNVDESVKLLATKMMIICAVAIPLDAVANACYFTLRSGGEAMITIIFDCGFMWVVSASVAFVLTSFTSLSILPIFAICQGLNFLKDVIGMIFVKKGKWVKRIVE